jgi:two-component sensor histidine kinase
MVGGPVPAAGVSAALLAYTWCYTDFGQHNFLPDQNAAMGLVGGAIMFATEIALIEVIRIAARRAHSKQELTDRLLAERNAMFSELQHRVANNMQFIASLLALQSRQMPADADGRHALNEASDRLVQFARVHRTLHDAQLANRCFDAITTDVLTGLLRATGCQHVTLVVQATPANLPLDATTTLILIATEAATNAIKHVFSKSLGSRLTVTLCRRMNGVLELVIADDGPGFPEIPEGTIRTSLGLKIIQALAQAVSGELITQTVGGAVVRIVFREQAWPATLPPDTHRSVLAGQQAGPSQGRC